MSQTHGPWTAWRSTPPPVLSAVTSAGLCGLGLAELRVFREALSAEEDRVSCWRRLVHGRVDVLQAQVTTGQELSVHDLVRALGDTGSGRSRRSLMHVSRRRWIFGTFRIWTSCASCGPRYPRMQTTSSA
ncbi:hypothetical protein [Nocardioides bigeumensis]|uniref:RsiG family protein n=1 Tax=Nocardioides bigeumensis TaxID=433657 RepID=UPI003CD056D2